MDGRGAFSVEAVLRHDEALRGAHDVELAGDLAFVPGKGGSLAIIDVRNAKKPGLTWFRRDPEGMRDAETVLPVGSRLLLGTLDFYSIDVSEPDSPRFSPKVPVGGPINGMVKRGDHVLAASKNGFLHAFDVGDLDAPRLVGSLNVREKFAFGAPHDIDVFGDHIVVAMPNGFGREPKGTVAVFRVADPQSHKLLPVGQWQLAGVANDERLVGANRVQVVGSFAYVGGSYAPRARRKRREGVSAALGVVDVSRPAEPRVVASVPFSDPRGPNGLTVAGKVVFLAGGLTVEAVDISDPHRPRTLAAQAFPLASPRARPPDSLHDLVYRDGYLYVSGQTDHSFLVLKVTDRRILALAE